MDWTATRGAPWLSKVVANVWRKNSKRLEFLRHIHASWLQEMGLDIRALADRLGHTQISLTLQVYTHAEVERQRATADQLGTWLAPDKPPQMTNI